VIVVCNTSPITNLAAIARLDLLHSIYGKIIPKAVYEELTNLPYSVLALVLGTSKYSYDN
jgi:uncharacterized protein